MSALQPALHIAQTGWHAKAMLVQRREFRALAKVHFLQTLTCAVKCFPDCVMLKLDVPVCADVIARSARPQRLSQVSFHTPETVLLPACHRAGLFSDLCPAE